MKILCLYIIKVILFQLLVLEMFHFIIVYLSVYWLERGVYHENLHIFCCPIIVKINIPF